MARPNTTWRKELEERLEELGLSWSDVISVAGGDAALDTPFNPGYGVAEGPAITVWTEDWVFFPLCYDGTEWLGKVPRNPNDIPLEHQGGG